MSITSKSIPFFLALVFIVFQNNTLFGQGSENPISLFEVVDLSPIERTIMDDSYGLEDYTILDIQDVNLTGVNNRQAASITLDIPISDNQNRTLILEINQILGGSFKVISGATGNEVPYTRGIHYFGSVSGVGQSIAGISIFDDHVMGVISYNGNNYNLEPLSLRNPNQSASRYIIYKDSDLPIPFNFNCDTNEPGNQGAPPNPNGQTQNDNKSSALAAVGIYIECDHQMYNDNGASIPATTSWTTAMMNVVFGIFATAFTNSGATTSSLFISQIVVWDTPDPYGTTIPGNNSNDILGNFVCNVPTYNGRIAHLLSTTNTHGGIAYSPYNATCIDENPNYGYSSIANSYNTNLNIYSWTINVVAHELGHQLSSPHTHACVWNGNNTQIDDCGNEWLASNGETPEGNACFDPANPIFPAAGTIMSYCHGNPSGTGVDLSLGFHPQVENQIGNYVENCIGTSVGGCMIPSSPTIIIISGITTNTATFTSNFTTGVGFYYWEYRPVGSATWLGSPASSTNSYNATGLLGNTLYELRLYVYCSATSSWSTATCLSNFTTLPCPTSYSIAGGSQLSGIQSTTADYETDGDIESNQTLINSITVDYDSKTSVTLMNNFSCNSSVNFTAFIDGCGNLIQEEEPDKN